MQRPILHRSTGNFVRDLNIIDGTSGPHDLNALRRHRDSLERDIEVLSGIWSSTVLDRGERMSDHQYAAYREEMRLRPDLVRLEREIFRLELTTGDFQDPDIIDHLAHQAYLRDQQAASAPAPTPAPPAPRRGRPRSPALSEFRGMFGPRPMPRPSSGPPPGENPQR